MILGDFDTYQALIRANSPAPFVACVSSSEIEKNHTHEFQTTYSSIQFCKLPNQIIPHRTTQLYHFGGVLKSIESHGPPPRAPLRHSCCSFSAMSSVDCGIAHQVVGQSFSPTKLREKSGTVTKCFIYR